VYGVPIEEPAAGRALWLAQVDEALKSAQRLLEVLPVQGEQHALACDLHMRIQAALLEVRNVRLGRAMSAPSEIHPKWIESNPWRRSPAAGDQTP
jgi:hypothetical protein